MKFKNVVAAVLVLVVAACRDVPTTAPASESVELAGGVSASAQGAPGDYIVIFNEGVADAPGLARRLAAQVGSSPRYIYSSAVRGFSAPMSAQAAEALTRNPNVAIVEADQVMSIDATQAGATWGLDRIDQRSLPLNGSYSYANTGAGVRAYIIDTGIRFDHLDFGGRASSGFDAVDGGAADDCNGHGTHVAGTVGGTTWGVAKGTTLVAVRVLDCAGSGSTSGVIAGVDWVAANAVRPAVANMSLGGGASSALDLAVSNAIASGVTFAIAAGNSNRDACKFSPARVPAAVTVGATTSSDARASYSNIGACLDIFAPGSGITSAWYTGTTATNTISGTSMAAPHVAGVAALYLQSNAAATPQAVRDWIVGNGTTGVLVGNLGRSSPNVLLFTNW